MVTVPDFGVKSQGTGVSGISNGHRSETLDVRLRGMRKNALRTLFGIACFSPKRVKTVDLAEYLQQHRSTTSVHLVELEEVGVVSKDIELGTEKKSKPTYLYAINSSVDSNDLYYFFKSRFPNDPLLGTGDRMDTSAPMKDAEAIANTVDPFVDGDTDSPDFVDPIEQTFESKIGIIVNGMAAQIMSLQARVSDLESQLSIQSSRGLGVDLSNAMNLVNSLNVAKKGGQHV
jgi:hypothetical protein